MGTFTKKQQRLKAEVQVNLGFMIFGHLVGHTLTTIFLWTLQDRINKNEAILDDLGLRDLDGWRGTEYQHRLFEQPLMAFDDYELLILVISIMNLYK